MSGISASLWGSPFAPRRALLIHGITGCSSTWEGVAQLLAAEGFFVVAPNLLGHAWRRGAGDYRHSLGGAVALSILPFLPQDKETSVILVDPALEISDEQVEMHANMFLQDVESAKTADQCMVEHPSWSRRDCVLSALGLSMCTSADIKDIILHNKPWSFTGLFKNIPSNVKITGLVADPKLSDICFLEHIPHDVNVRVITGAGHCIPFERPDAIIDAIPLARG